MRRSGQRLGIAILLIVGAASLTAPPEVRAGGFVADTWSAPITWRDQNGNEANCEHVALMPNGQLIFIGYQTGEYSMIPPVLVDAGLVSLEQDVFLFDNSTLYPDPDMHPSCGGHTLLADGTLIAVGGDDWDAGGGNRWAITYNGFGFALVPEPMVGLGENPALGPVRWYPATTRLADLRILVTSGIAAWNPWQINLSVEVFDPSSGSWELLSAHDDSPVQIYNRDYTHVFQLPEDLGVYDTLMFGESGYPVLFSTSTGDWNVVNDRRPDAPGDNPSSPNHGASTLLLPIRVTDGEWGYSNGSVLMAGGQHFQSYESHADVFDPVVGEWKDRIDLTVARHHPSTVLLPDGRVLVVAGHSNLSAPEDLGKAQYIDPANGFTMTIGQSSYGEVRGYHTVTVLLPDGRVLVGSGNPDGVAGNERTDFRYYYPDYMSEPRPEILDAPAVLEHGQSYEVTWDSTSPVTEVVAVALGSMTHSVDMNQRHVQLEITSTAGNSTSFLAPADSTIAPAGHYMLFLLDANRTPSEAEIVRIDAADVDDDDVIDLVDNCPDAPNPGQEDADDDAIGDACDNCVYTANPSQGAAVLGRAIEAVNPSTFAWDKPAEIVYARGDLAQVGAYAVDLVNSVPLGTSFTDLSAPGSGAGFYYLVRPDCSVGSWQTDLGAEPARDDLLP